MIFNDNASYVHAKGGCYVCGSPHNVVDTEATIDYEGALAICRGCIADMAGCAGFTLTGLEDQTDLVRLRLELADVSRQRDEAEETIKAMIAKGAEVRRRQRAERESKEVSA